MNALPPDSNWQVAQPLRQRVPVLKHVLNRLMPERSFVAMQSNTDEFKLTEKGQEIDPKRLAGKLKDSAYDLQLAQEIYKEHGLVFLKPKSPSGWRRIFHPTTWPLVKTLDQKFIQPRKLSGQVKKLLAQQGKITSANSMQARQANQRFEVLDEQSRLKALRSFRRLTEKLSKADIETILDVSKPLPPRGYFLAFVELVVFAGIPRSEAFQWALERTDELEVPDSIAEKIISEFSKNDANTKTKALQTFQTLIKDKPKDFQHLYALFTTEDQAPQLNESAYEPFVQLIAGSLPDVSIRDAHQLAEQLCNADAEVRQEVWSFLGEQTRLAVLQNALEKEWRTLFPKNTLPQQQAWKRLTEIVTGNVTSSKISPKRLTEEERVYEQVQSVFLKLWNISTQDNPQRLSEADIQQLFDVFMVLSAPKLAEKLQEPALPIPPTELKQQLFEASTPAEMLDIATKALGDKAYYYRDNTEWQSSRKPFGADRQARIALEKFLNSTWPTEQEDMHHTLAVLQDELNKVYVGEVTDRKALRQASTQAADAIGSLLESTFTEQREAKRLSQQSPPKNDSQGGAQTSTVTLDEINAAKQMVAFYEQLEALWKILPHV